MHSNKHISTDFPYASKYIDVLGSKMHYVEKGQGNPILLLHGVPTSAYLWRNIIPHLSTLGRCIAPDLIGMGKSDKPNIDYTIFDHIQYIENFVQALELHHLTIVMHGWGSIIGLDYAMRHSHNCKGLVLYESYLGPCTDEMLSLPLREHILSLQHETQQQTHSLTGSHLVEKMLLPCALRHLSQAELEYYCAPFLKKGSEKPLQQYLQEIPMGKDRSNIHQIITHYSAHLTKSSLPKLLLYSLPGFIATMHMIEWAKAHLPHLEVIEVGEDIHYAQESNPDLLGETISVWLQGIEQHA